MTRPLLAVALLLSLGLGLPVARAGEVTVAVAANFAAPMKIVAEQFAQATGHVARASFASTGKLYAQIRHGAPFDVLLSADAETPARLQDEGKAVAGSAFTYAVGQLALWSPDPTRIPDGPQALNEARFNHLAIANPRTAPYGAAAMAVIRRLGLLGTLQEKLVQGDNVGQAYQYVASGNAEIGLVALSQVMEGGRLTRGAVWAVPADLHPPLTQDAVLLTRGRDNPAARAFLAYLRGDTARALIRAAGYALP